MEQVVKLTMNIETIDGQSRTAVIVGPVGEMRNELTKVFGVMVSAANAKDAKAAFSRADLHAANSEDDSMANAALQALGKGLSMDEVLSLLGVTPPEASPEPAPKERKIERGSKELEVKRLLSLLSVLGSLRAALGDPEEPAPEMSLAASGHDCQQCESNGNCSLQQFYQEMGFEKIPDYLKN